MKVYINIPSQAVAGGVESLYQLADAIKNVGGESYVVFDNNISNPIPEKYSHYNLDISTNVDDSKDNWIIYPEVWTDRINEFKNIKKAIWWLSVDNNNYKFQDFQNPNITHFYQSYYALTYLINNEASYYLPIFDYINNNYINQHVDINNKQNIVCYNPAKGQQITNEIIKSYPHISFVPLTNMDEHQIIETLKSSKVYIDFGNHPGRDRIPREAAILHNCVIVGFKGSASFYNDIPINNTYKFINIDNIGDIIEKCFNNFDNHINDFSLYRKNIKHQKEQLFNQVKQYFV
jgi:hypothetical protein